MQAYCANLKALLNMPVGLLGHHTKIDAIFNFD
jgi:hypothetical protein